MNVVYTQKTFLFNFIAFLIFTPLRSIIIRQCCNGNRYIHICSVVMIWWCFCAKLGEGLRCSSILQLPRIDALVSAGNIGLSQAETLIPSAISRRSNTSAYKSIRPYSCRGPRITLNIASQLTTTGHWGIIVRAPAVAISTCMSKQCGAFRSLCCHQDI